MLKWIKNSKSNIKTKTGYKGIVKNATGKYVAEINIRLSSGKNKPKKVGYINIGTFDTLKEAKKARVEYIINLL